MSEVLAMDHKEEDSLSNERMISSGEEEVSSSSIEESYRIDDSDSDEEEEVSNSDEYSQSDEMAKLKEQTSQLLDVKWKEERNLHLLNKMLELEEPTISAKMVDFLLQAGVCESLTNFITQVGTTRRPYPHESNSAELKYSYRATMLLSVDEPSDALLNFLSKKARVIAQCMFDIFRDDSAGSFYHAARVLECLLRVYPGEVYQGLNADGLLEERMTSILRYIGYPPVGDLVVILVALTPVPRSSPVYSSCSKSRFTFFEGLANWDFMLRLAKIIVYPSDYCRVDEYITAELHCAAASQTFNELVEKLSSEDMAEVLLQPLGSSPELLKGFVDRATGMADGVKDEAAAALETSDPDMFLTSRQSSLRMLSFLLKKSSNPQNSYFVMNPQGQPVQTLVPNRLYPLRPVMVSYLATRIKDLEHVMVETTVAAQSSDKSGSEEGNEGGAVVVAHPGHVCSVPFSSYRSQLVELFVLLVEASSSGAEYSGSVNFCEEVPVELWKCLIFWVFEYAHNNIYHTMFYRILFSVLRQNNEICLRNVFKNCRLVTYLIDAFEPFDDAFEKEYDESTNITMGDKTSEHKLVITLKDRNALRGVLINLCNAIRLQVSSLPPTSFLRNYLHSHSAWNEFVPILLKDTLVQQPPGLGHYIPTPETRNGANYMAALLSIQQNDGDGIEHGSNFAKFLGFEEEIEWPEEPTEPKKKKNKKKKKKKNKDKGKKHYDPFSDIALSSDSEEDDNFSIDKFLKAKVKIAQPGVDGLYWMQIEDFVELFNRVYVLEDIADLQENLVSRRFASKWVPGDYIVGSGGPPTDPADQESESESDESVAASVKKKKEKDKSSEKPDKSDKSGDEEESSEEESEEESSEEESESDESDNTPADPFTDNPMYPFTVGEPTHLSISLFQADRRWTVSRLGQANPGVVTASSFAVRGARIEACMNYERAIGFVLLNLSGAK
mmetsp:Transcript_295/g.661  ORF Transcript_295/g.661 Transcript_295/m.661 type:complete len:952 (-) Transcript_295:9-2864(-)